MVVYRRSQRRTVLALLVLTSVTLVTLDLRDPSAGGMGAIRRAVREAYAPVESAADAVFSPVGDFIDGVTRVGSLERENARLRRRLAEVEGQLARARGLDRENKVLHELLALDFAEAIEGVVARVVSESPTNFEWSLVIDRGSAEGIARDMPVVAGEGLVGRVVQVSPSRSKVLLVTDPRMAVGVRFAGSGETGVAEGLAGKDLLNVELVDPDTPVQPDELVVTSGLQQARYPAGIPVGTVVSVSNRPGALQKDVRLKPLVDLDRLEFVKVLLWRPRR